MIPIKRNHIIIVLVVAILLASGYYYTTLELVSQDVTIELRAYDTNFDVPYFGADSIIEAVQSNDGDTSYTYTASDGDRDVLLKLPMDEVMSYQTDYHIESIEVYGYFKAEEGTVGVGVDCRGTGQRAFASNMGDTWLSPDNYQLVSGVAEKSGTGNYWTWDEMENFRIGYDFFTYKQDSPSMRLFRTIHGKGRCTEMYAVFNLIPRYYIAIRGVSYPSSILVGEEMRRTPDSDKIQFDTYQLKTRQGSGPINYVRHDPEDIHVIVERDGVFVEEFDKSSWKVFKWAGGGTYEVLYNKFDTPGLYEFTIECSSIGFVPASKTVPIECLAAPPPTPVTTEYSGDATIVLDSYCSMDCTSPFLDTDVGRFYIYGTECTTGDEVSILGVSYPVGTVLSISGEYGDMDCPTTGTYDYIVVTNIDDTELVTSTPGFELLILICAIGFYIYIKRRK